MTYRILSLDGGGTWALIQVKALIALYSENTPGREVLRDFNLVAASSGGSIVLGGMLENLKLGEILNLFEDQTTRKSIFSDTEVIGDRVLRDLTGLGPKYSTKNELPALKRVLADTGNTPLTEVASGLPGHGSDQDLHLLIIGFDYDRNRAAFFRSAESSGPEWGKGETANVTLAEAIHASTNAPVNYFDAPATFPGGMDRYWDGAIAGCNNPVLAAATEAIVRRVNPTDIVALSIGTASVALPWALAGQPQSPYTQPILEPGLVTDLHKLATSILDDPPDIATFLAHVLTGSGIGLDMPAPKSRIVRMNPLISPLRNQSGEWSPPGSMNEIEFKYLAALDMDAVEQSQVDAISNYADLWWQDAAPNQPIRMNGDTLVPELGQIRFSDAAAAWNAIK